MYCDASQVGLAHVLIKHGKVVVYDSWQVKVHEKNYQTFNLEYAAVVYSLKIEVLFVWCSCLCVYRPQESLICVYSKGVESPANEVVRVIEGLRHECSLAPRQS